jgi:hypothetical protein
VTEHRIPCIRAVVYSQRPKLMLPGRVPVYEVNAGEVAGPVDMPCSSADRENSQIPQVLNF